MTSTPVSCPPVGHVVCEELRTDAAETAQALVDLLAAEMRGWVGGREGFLSARLHLSPDGTTVVSCVEWAEEKHHAAAAESCPADSPLRTLSERPGVVSHTSFVNPPQWLTEDSLRAGVDAPANRTRQEQAYAGAAGPAAGAGSTGSLTTGVMSPLGQLRLFEKKYDPSSAEVLDGLPFDPAWRCLELGAGAGSMSRWLAERAHRGSVLAVDADTTFLDAGHAANLTVRQADIDQLEFPPDSFDLVFTRATLEHLRDPDAALARARGWLAPGGWLVVGDFYYMPADEAPTAVGRALLRGYVDRMKAVGADMSWARGLPAALTRTGLTSVGTHLTAAGPGQSPADDELIGLRMRQEGQNLVDSGLVTAEQLADFLGTLGTPAARDLTALLVTAWGRRPAD